MWTYEQSTGSLWNDAGELVGAGYSGYGASRNRPSHEDRPNQGPIPRGTYSIGAPFDSQHNGPFVLRLTPDKSNDMFGRSGFLIHGDSITYPGMASHGCIILPRVIRQRIWLSGVRRLRVVNTLDGHGA